MTDSLVPPTWEPVDPELVAFADAARRGDHLPEGDAYLLVLRAVGPLIAARALREAADVCVSDTKGPISGTGIVGPLQVMGIAQGLTIAANILRRRAAALEGRAHV